MPKITFLNTNQTFDAQIGETVLDVAIRHDVPLSHACGGFCSCTTCHIHVQSGANSVAPIEEDEKDRLEFVNSDLKPESRLGCQTKIQGDVSVTIMQLDR